MRRVATHADFSCRNELSAFVTSPDGLKAQEKLWAELVDKFEAIQPGITADLGI